jgi:hypothetical protein
MLRTEKRFYAPDLPTYVEKASEVGKRIDGLLPVWFGKLPRLTWTIRVKPPELKASSSGYDLGDPQKGAPGTVVVSSHSYQSPLFGLPAWILHEGVPGHHCRSRSVRKGPIYRHSGEKTSPPRSSRAGRCMRSSWVRRWASTGTRTSASAGCRSTCGAPAAWKCMLVSIGKIGQGAGGKLPAGQYSTSGNVRCAGNAGVISPGPRKRWHTRSASCNSLAERRRAEQALGTRFDIRAFHDAVLDDGPMPLSILHDQVSGWIASGTSGSNTHP